MDDEIPNKVVIFEFHTAFLLIELLGGATKATPPFASPTSFAHMALTRYICQNAAPSIRSPLHISQAIKLSAAICYSRLWAVGFLDTFDLFDSFLAAFPENFL